MWKKLVETSVETSAETSAKLAETSAEVSAETSVETSAETSAETSTSWSGFLDTAENVWSESFSVRTSKGRAPASELVLLRGGLPSEIALQGRGSLESKIVYRKVGADLGKTENIFSAHRVTCNV